MKLLKTTNAHELILAVVYEVFKSNLHNNLNLPPLLFPNDDGILKAVKDKLFKNEIIELLSKGLSPTVWSPISAGIKINENVLSKSMPYITWYFLTLRPVFYPQEPKLFKKVEFPEYEALSDQYDKMFERLKCRPYKYNMQENSENGIFAGNSCFFTQDKVEKEIILPNFYTQTSECIGYLDFLIGHPNCMDSILLVGEFHGQIDSEIIKAGWRKDYLPDLNRFSTKDVTTNKAVTYLTIDRIGFGNRIAIGNADSKFYMQSNSDLIEYSTSIFPQPAYTLRYYLETNDTHLQVGEFIAIAVRAKMGLFLGHHEQETNPFIYSGIWLDVLSYSAGVIYAVIDETEGEYIVKLHGFLFFVKTSDYKIYKEGERVGILVVRESLQATNKLYSYWENPKGYKIVPLTYAVS